MFGNRAFSLPGSSWLFSGTRNHWFCNHHGSASHLGEAGRAVDGIAVARHEWYRRLLAAFGTGYFGLGTIWQAELGLSCRSAMRTSSWDVNQFFLAEEMLFTCCPGKWLATIAARQCLV